MQMILGLPQTWKLLNRFSINKDRIFFSNFFFFFLLNPLSRTDKKNNSCGDKQALAESQKSEKGSIERVD